MDVLTMFGVSLVAAAAAGFAAQLLKREQTLEDHCRHWYLIGKTGCGKSSTLRTRLLIPWIEKGYGALVLETKDKTTVDDILNSIPEEHHHRVIVFDPLAMAETGRWIGLNLLEDNYELPTSSTLICGEILSILKRHFGKDAIQARSEDYFRNAILACLEFKDSTILEVYKILVDADFRTIVAAHLKNLVVREYYGKYFSDKPGELAAPLNKLRAFLSNPLIINIMGQPKGLNIREIIEEQKILIALLPKGIIGEDTARLLASTLLSKAQLAAQSRADIPKAERYRRPFQITCDEFQDYANESFNAFLEQARAFGVSLVIAHQLLKQKGISQDIISSIKGNCGNFLLLRCGIEDSRELEQLVKVEGKEKQKFDRLFLENMPNHTYVEKITVNDKQKGPVYRKNPRPCFIGNFADKLREQSLEHLGTDEAIIKEFITRRLGIEQPAASMDQTPPRPPAGKVKEGAPAAVKGGKDAYASGTRKAGKCRSKRAAAAV